MRRRLVLGKVFGVRVAIDPFIHLAGFHGFELCEEALACTSDEAERIVEDHVKLTMPVIRELKANSKATTAVLPVLLKPFSLRG